MFDWIKEFGLRKFVALLLIIIVSTVLLVLKHITSEDYSKIISPVGVAFMASNSVEHMTSAVKTWIKDKWSELKKEDK